MVTPITTMSGLAPPQFSPCRNKWAKDAQANAINSTFSPIAGALFVIPAKAGIQTVPVVPDPVVTARAVRFFSSQ
ncbi:MAG: hypothetical protein AB1545_13555 [Thermodesulfobacteriota bacterium]